MNRKLVLIMAVLSVCVASIVFAVAREQTVTVDTKILTSQSVDKTITCNGIVEAGKSEGIFTETSCYIGEVFARKGRYVQKGEILATIDKEATKAYGQSSQYDALALSAMSEEIRATKSGVILKLDITDGGWIDKTSPCAVIAPSDCIQVRVAIREKHLPLLHTGLSASISGAGLQEDNYQGVLTEISSTALTLDNGDTVVEGVIEFKDVIDDPSLRIGINVKATIVVDTVADGIVIPYDAVGESDGGSFVYVMQGDGIKKHTIGYNEEISDGLLISDIQLDGCSVVLNPESIIVGKRVRYVSTEDDK